MSARAHWANPVGTGEQDEAIRQLIASGKEKGYLLREEIDAVLPVDGTASSVLDDVRSRCGEAGIDVDAESLERETIDSARMHADEIDLTPSRADTSGDVVRLYLTDMSRVPLLTRHEEVALAKQIERGHRTVMVAISHTPSLVQQVLRLADTLREDDRVIRRLVTHRFGEVTATRLKKRARRVRAQIEAVGDAWAEAEVRHVAWQRVPRRYRHIAQRAHWQLRRARGRVAQRLRRIAFSDAARRDPRRAVPGLGSQGRGGAARGRRDRATPAPSTHGDTADGHATPARTSGPDQGQSRAGHADGAAAADTRGGAADA